MLMMLILFLGIGWIPHDAHNAGPFEGLVGEADSS